VARRLKGCLRPEDTVARLGGDEFTVLLEDVTEESEAIRVAERIAAKLKPPFMLGGHEVFATPSIGIALGTSTGEDQPEDLLRTADMAMYQAKTAGKDYHLADEPGTNQPALKRLKLERDLRWAIEREQFRVYYQPMIELASGTIVGMEALVRWNHPRRSLVPPDEFITLAEETGLIIQIGRWVLKEACQQAREWQEQHPTDKSWMISVNLSEKQLQQPQLVEEVAQVLQTTGLDPACLVLEITETTLMENILSTTATLKRLKNLGVQLAIDDFGAGYSSLSFLKHFPVDMLKIDKSFIDGLEQDADEVAIVGGVIHIAHNLGLKVVAEGLETTEQLNQLNALRCEIGQGYHFAKPLSGREAREALLKNVYS
jgi:EAL domain-containing protein (putative c-di-GMP-specific phosphodiesterase class I)